MRILNKLDMIAHDVHILALANEVIKCIAIEAWVFGDKANTNHIQSHSQQRALRATSNVNCTPMHYYQNAPRSYRKSEYLERVPRSSGRSESLRSNLARALASSEASTAQTPAMCARNYCQAKNYYSDVQSSECRKLCST